MFFFSFFLDFFQFGAEDVRDVVSLDPQLLEQFGFSDIDTK